jgi:hypothetical protein
VVSLTDSVCIEAPAAEVWARLAELDDLALWSEPVRVARCDGPITSGVGAVRTCDLVGGITTTERWIAWEVICAIAEVQPADGGFA